MRSAALVAALLGSGCFAFLDGFGDDDDCDFGVAAEGLAQVEQRRDPFSGQCAEVVPPGDGDPCGAVGAEADRAPEIPRALCYAGCEGLAEAACFDAPGCRAAYIGGGDSLAYYDCWSAVEPDVGLADPSQCNTLDAVTCSLYNNCSAVHDSGCLLGDACSDTDVGPFLQCITEGPLELE